MGIYLRKSIGVGPLRFNLSKSGIGVSAGIKGLRLGAGPRGNYIHMGRNGLYYRKTISTPGKGENNRPDRINETPVIESYPTTHKPLEEIESADVSSMVDSSSMELLEELNAKRKKSRLWPWAFAILIILLLFLISKNVPIWLLLVCIIVGVIAVVLVSIRDQMSKTVVMFYDFDEVLEKAYERLHEAANNLAQCNKIWHIESQGDVIDRKYHAGASKLVQRKATTIQRSQPPYVKTNIDTIAIPVGRQTLHLFPDRVLVYDKDGVGAVGYRDLKIDVNTSKFIESEGVPTDAIIIDRTWKYVNKQGGPDKRFKDNVELPVCLYEEIDLTSHTGLNERLQLSKNNIGNLLVGAVAELSSVIPKEK
jgi:hypothetical protein